MEPVSVSDLADRLIGMVSADASIDELKDRVAETYVTKVRCRRLLERAEAALTDARIDYIDACDEHDKAQENLYAEIVKDIE